MLSACHAASLVRRGPLWIGGDGRDRCGTRTSTCANAAIFNPITYPAAGTHLYPGPLDKLRHTADVPPFRPAPMLGEHNEYLDKDLIGLSNEQYQSLIDDQIVSTVYLETAHALPLRQRGADGPADRCHTCHYQALQFRAAELRRAFAKKIANVTENAVLRASDEPSRRDCSI